MENILLEVKDLSKYYGKLAALDHVSLSLDAGKIIGLLGPNGSGKTTLIKILNGLLAHYSGEVKIAGEPVGAGSKQLISYLPDEPYF